MIGPLLNLIARRPDLIIDHIASYAALAQNQIEATKARLVTRIVAGIVALAFGTAALVLAGVALMLGTAVADLQASWALFAAPGIALIVCVLAARVALAGTPELNTQVSLGAQFRRDLNALKIATGDRT